MQKLWQLSTVKKLNMKDQLTPLKQTGIYISEIPANGTPLNIKYPDNLIQIDKEFYEILGTITSDIISFDPAPYLESKVVNFVGRGKALMYRDYMNDEETFLHSETESFYSLLNSCGYYWVNPMGKEPELTHPDIGSQYYACELDAHFRWQSFEDNLVTNILLSLIKK